MAVESSLVSTALPTVPEDVTAAWLSSVLGHPVKTAEFTSKAVVATASKLFLSLTYEDDDLSPSETRPRHICVKGGFNPAIIAVNKLFLMDLYAGEVLFYSAIAPGLRDRVKLPTTWWAGASDEQAIVIMEDLAKAGCGFGDSAQAWPVARVRGGVRQLAALHASTWNPKGGASEGGGFSPSPSCSVDPLQFPTSERMDRLIEGILPHFDRLVMGPERPPIPESWKNQSRIWSLLLKLYASRNPRFMCLIHGDAHTGNIYFEPTAEPGFDGWKGYFLDWQTAHVGSCFQDVAYFVGGALTIEDRRAHEMDILDYYLECLAELGGPRLSRSDDEVLIEYRKSCLAGWTWLFVPFHMHSKEKVFAMIERYVAQMQDNGSTELVESL